MTSEVRRAVPYQIRPVRWDDAQRLQDLLHNLSDESRFMRFMSNMKEFPPGQLDRFTHPSEKTEAALAAVTQTNGQEQIIGVARYMTLPQKDQGKKKAEFAIVVLDQFHNQGIGSTLMHQLCTVARDHGLEQIEGYVLGQNPAMLKLMHHLGFKIEVDPEDVSMRRVTKDL
jgi:acetyltransferase